MEKIKVLYIDDEQDNLNAFKSSFRRQFEIHTGISAYEGLKVLNEHAIEVIISDQRMPGTSGTEFFEQISLLYPNPIRILLTGYSDINAVIDAVNKGNIYRYVSKPWHEYDLKLTIENAYELYSIRDQNNKLTSKYKKIFTESSDPILLFDTKGRIVDYNKSAMDLFKTKDDKLSMMTINSLISMKNDADRIFHLLDKNDTITAYECLVNGKSELRNCLFSINKINNYSGKTMNYQAVIKDITERTRTSQLLLKKVIETQEEERERIARDLHDGIGQYLSATSLHFESLKSKFNKNNNFTEELESIPNLLSEATNELRKICFNTLPQELKENNLPIAIQKLTNSVTNSEFKVKFTIQNNFPEVNESLAVSIFRIVQEFVNNSIKHSKSTEVLINFEHDEKSIILNLSDNGIGFNIREFDLSKGRGLKNIKNRVESFNGILDLKSAADQGTNFDISIPIILNNEKVNNQFIMLN